ncbi:methyl-accepting chemotaxis protein [Cytobacillus massiliigabonensis]|uniref:methyl-accepting chemotaxis protein n=1 Tax=Cytobacillus massiliigabonensis TaxID=1871011 RepID=UPI000C833A45|nr:HAMP domain-containing methyl-accepting chemotaxis protein [Cytobacillus massiliigabonensis]
MNMKQKLLLVALIPLILSGGIIGAIIFQMNQIQSNSSSTVKELTNVEKLNGSFVSVQSSLINFSFSTSDANAESVEIYIKETEKLINWFDQVNTKEQKELVEKIKGKFGSLKEESEKAISGKDQAESKKQALRTKGILNDIYQLNRLTNDMYLLGESELKSKISFIQMFAIISLIALLLIASVLVYIQTNKMALAVRRIAQNAQSVADGDLTIETIVVKSKDEIYYLNTAFHQMVENLKELISTIGNTSEQVAASAEELSASADEASKGTELITSSIQQVSSGADHQNLMTQKSAKAVKETAVGVIRIAEGAEKVTAVTNVTQMQAMEGQKFVTETVKQMDSIKQAVETTDQSVAALDEKSKQITDIVKLISDIADQTNLLALNAAIEAARAGESGKGFAVVAAEVRKLAEQTTNSAGQIHQIILDVQTEMDVSVKSMDEVKGKVNEGIKITNETAQKFNEILNGMEEVAEQINEIHVISEQISAGSEEVSTSVNEMAELAIKTSSNAHEVASISEEQLASMIEVNSSAYALTNIAEELNELIRKFRIT